MGLKDGDGIPSCAEGAEADFVGREAEGCEECRLNRICVNSTVTDDTSAGQSVEAVVK